MANYRLHKDHRTYLSRFGFDTLTPIIRSFSTAYKLQLQVSSIKYQDQTVTVIRNTILIILILNVFYTVRMSCSGRQGVSDRARF